MDEFEALALEALAARNRSQQQPPQPNPDQAASAATGTRADAAAVQNTVETLRPLVESGQARPAEVQAYNQALQQLEAANQTTGEYNSRFRGFAHDALLGQWDTAAGVASWVQGDGYAAGRDAVRDADRAAYEANPAEFEGGQLAGGLTSGAATAGLGLPAIKGMSWLGRAALGTGAGAGLTGNQVVQDEQIKGDPKRGVIESLLKNAGTVGMGALIGGGAFPLAAATGAAVRGIGKMGEGGVAGYGRRASGMLTDTTERAVRSGAAPQTELSGLTDDAMLVDLPEYRRMGQGLAVQGGEGGMNLTRGVRDRANTNSERIKSEIERYIAGPTEAFDAKTAEAANRHHNLSPQYTAALQKPDPVDATSVARLVKDKSTNAVGTVRSSLDGLLSDLGDGNVSAVKLHNIRSELSDKIEEARSAPRPKYVGQMKDILAEIDAALDDQVLGYQKARTDWANSMAMDDAVEDGASILNGGKSTAEAPWEFQGRFDKMSPAQQAAMRKGLGGQVARIMGTSSNDAAAAWRELSDKGWNADKLRIVLGPDAEPIIKRLRAEKVFSETRGDIERGSQTEMRRQAAEQLGPIADPATGQRPGPVIRAKQAFFDGPINRAADAVVYGPRTKNADLELGKMLGAQGAERDEIVEALLRRLQQRNMKPTVSPAVEKIVEALGVTLAAPGAQTSAGSR